MTTTIRCLETAQQLAMALDAEDYEAVRSCLANDCVYFGPDGVLFGPGAIVASYRDHGSSASQRFDEVAYESLVEPAGLSEVVVTFTDRVRLSGTWHQFRCRQRVRVADSGLVEEIRHEELPGERERLRQFEVETGEGRSSHDSH
jgi:hypothetical protein